VTHRAPFFLSLVYLTVLTVATAIPVAAADDPPNAIDYSMWFLSDVRDTPECDLTYADGRYDFGATVTNPAMSCPDSFAWTLFAKAVKAGFWENWTSDRQAFPPDPWPRCKPGEAAETCCSGLVMSNEAWPQHCPVFPGATPGMPDYVLEPPSKAHAAALFAATGTIDATLGDWDTVPDNLRAAVIGSIQNELVFRNEVMMQYLFDRQMYHLEGLKAIFDAHERALGAYAPYHPKILAPNTRFADPQTPSMVQFPIGAIMLKANFVSFDHARKLGIDPDDPDHPYIVVNLAPKPDDIRPAGPDIEPQPQLLLSFHISSKDVPNWFWATFEHVANPGRCDWLGCNDSFGYRVTGKLDARGDIDTLQGPSPTYLPPHQLRDVDGSSVGAFALSRPYVGRDTITPALDALFRSLDIGTAADANTAGRPTARDRAWRSYRLKGSQTDFVTSTGRPTRLGNSVTEAGFVNNASCISCHSRAAIDREGAPALDIFVDDLSYAGIPRSHSGPPNAAWFYVNGYYGVNDEREAPAVRAVPADFVFGLRNACSIRESPFGPPWCANRKAAD